MTNFRLFQTERVGSTCHNSAYSVPTSNMMVPITRGMPNEFAEDDFKLYQNDGKFFKRVENTVGRREIARNRQYLLSPQFCQTTCTVDT